MPRSVSVACSSAVPSSRRMRTPASVWMALRVEAPRARDGELRQERFTGNGELQEIYPFMEEGVGAVE